MKTLSYKKIIEKGSISSELELEQAMIMERKLRLMAKKDSEFSESRNQLRAIIMDYEDKNWSKNGIISEKKIEESDTAEFIAEKERQFFAKRKGLIKSKLTESGINQQDLGIILGHSKSYISELMNGISPFTLKDLIIVHNLFNIKLEHLIAITISPKENERIVSTFIRINKSRLKFAKT